MRNSGHGTPTPWGTDVDPRGAVDVPPVSSMASAPNWFRKWLVKVTALLNIFENPPRDDDVPKSVCCQPACGFVLTCTYLVGVILIILLYFTLSHDGRPPVVRIEYVSWEKIQDGSMEDYFCTCDLPAQVQNYKKDDPQIQPNSVKRDPNRCYSLDEVQNIEVLQFGEDTVVDHIINRTKSEIVSYVKTLNSNYNVRWKSYELTSSQNQDLFDRFDEHPIPSLSQKLEARGYVGHDGVISLRALEGDDFFTMPQGFIRADVNYTCTNCTACRELWAKYGAAQAAPELNSSSWGRDDGWIFCYQTFPERNDGVCQGACRFFPTLYQPWGIAMHDFALEVKEYIRSSSDDDPEPRVFFRSRIVYAFVEELQPAKNENYELRFMVIQRSDVLWAEILRYYPNISSCAMEDEYCTGTGICQAAAIYAKEEINSETIGIECLDSEKGNPPRTKCEDTKEDLKLEFRHKNDSRLERLCEPFKCESLKSTQITWNGNELVGGEIALSRLIYTPSVLSRYRPSLCINNYRDVFVKRNDSEIVSIHEMKCNRSTNAKVCCMTGRYKNVTDATWDDWNYEFNADEMAEGKKMFACYRFHKKAYPMYMYEQFGVVSGNIGSWLLVLSCIFWLITKTNVAAILEARWVPPENAETPHANRPQTEMSEIVTGPDDGDDNTSEQNPTKQKTSYQRLPK